jgi:hypothetical protein
MSLTITGLIITALTNFLGPVVTTGQVESFVTVAGLIIGLAVSYWGRIRQGDVDWMGRKS